MFQEEFEVEGDSAVGDKHGAWRSRTASIPVMHDYQIYCYGNFIDIPQSKRC